MILEQSLNNKKVCCVWKGKIIDVISSWLEGDLGYVVVFKLTLAKNLKITIEIRLKTKEEAMCISV